MRGARLIARVAVGGLFIGHGTQKLFGWFDGAGVDETADSFDRMGLQPGRRHAVAAGVAETAGGALLAMGLLTPVAAAALTGVMVTAIRKVHAANGPWAAAGGYEYNLVLLALLGILTEEGPGPASLDAALGLHLSGPGWLAAELTAGIAGSALTTSSAINTAAR